jgi:desulfoferrodoxin (superoxide reductase-like protein)
MKKTVILVIMLFCLSLAGVWANKTKVEIKAPAEVKAGTEITITINVMHKGNSNAHHTDWVYLKINGNEVMRWEYKKNALPSGENFTVEFKYVAGEELKLEAEGHCNIHGTAGPGIAAVIIAK